MHRTPRSVSTRSCDRTPRTPGRYSPSSRCASPTMPCDVRVLRLRGQTTRAFTERVAELVKREVRRGEQPARLVVFGIANERGRQHALGFHRSSAVTGRARLTQQDVAQRDGRGKVAGIALEGPHARDRRGGRAPRARSRPVSRLSPASRRAKRRGRRVRRAGAQAVMKEGRSERGSTSRSASDVRSQSPRRTR